MQHSDVHTPAPARSVQQLRRLWPWLAIALIGLAAFLIRAWTVRGGLPYVDHPDEPNPIDYVVRMLRSGDPNPHAFQKPSLYVYLLLAVLSLHYRLGRASGLYDALDRMNVTTHVVTTIPGFFLWGRMLTVLIAALTVLFVYRIGRRVWGEGAGLNGALLLAISAFHMRHSQYVTTDVTSAWLVLLAFGAAAAVAQAGRWRDYLAAGVLAGLAAATKYNAGVAALMVAVAYMCDSWRAADGAAGPDAARRLRAAGLDALRRLPRLCAAGLAALAGFFVGTPYALLSWEEFRRGILGQVEDYAEITHGDFTGAWNVRGYFNFFTGEGLGQIACVLLLAGLALLLWRRRAVALVWLSFSIPYLLLHMAQSSHFNRNMVALVVLGMLPIGIASAELIGWLGRLAAGRLAGAAALAARGAILAGVLLALLLPTGITTWQYEARLLRGDTRVQLMAWIDAQVPPGVRLAAEMRELPGPLESRWAEAPGLLRHDLEWYRQQGYAYVVASSDTWKQWPIPDDYISFAGGAPVAEFGGASSRDMFGPHLVVYSTGLGAAAPPQRPAASATVGGAQLLGVAVGQPDPKAQHLGVNVGQIFKPGQVLGLRTFWQVVQPFDRDYFIFVHVLNADGATVAQRDTPPWQGRFPTSSWRAGSLVVDVNDLALPDGLAPGSYTIAVGMFDPNGGATPPMSLGGQPAGQLLVTSIEVRN